VQVCKALLSGGKRWEMNDADRQAWHDAEARTETDESAFTHAATNGHLAVLKFLAENGVIPDKEARELRGFLSSFFFLCDKTFSNNLTPAPLSDCCTRESPVSAQPKIHTSATLRQLYI